MSDETKCEYCSGYVASQSDIHECGQCAVHICTECMDGQDFCHECLEGEAMSTLEACNHDYWVWRKSKEVKP